MTGDEQAERAVTLLLRLRDCLRVFKARAEERDKKMLLLVSLRDYEKRNKRTATMSEISRLTGMALPNVTRLLRPYEDEGLIERRKCGRNVSVTVTEKGERLLQRHRAFFVQGMKSVLSVLDDDEREAFIASGQKLIEHIEAKSGNQPSGDTDVSTLQKS